MLKSEKLLKLFEVEIEKINKLFVINKFDEVLLKEIELISEKIDDYFDELISESIKEKTIPSYVNYIKEIYKQTNDKLNTFYDENLEKEKTPTIKKEPYNSNNRKINNTKKDTVQVIDKSLFTEEFVEKINDIRNNNLKRKYVKIKPIDKTEPIDKTKKQPNIIKDKKVDFIVKKTFNKKLQDFVEPLEHFLYKSFPPQAKIQNKYIQKSVLNFKQKLKEEPPKNEEEFLTFKNDFLIILKENKLFLDYVKSENINPERLSIRDIPLSATVKKPDFFDEKIFDYDTKSLEVKEFNDKISSLKNNKDTLKLNDVKLNTKEKINFKI